MVEVHEDKLAEEFEKPTKEGRIGIGTVVKKASIAFDHDSPRSR